MSVRSFFGGRAVMHHGDSRERLKTLADASADSVVCDPPYALVSIVKRFGGENAAPAKDGRGASGPYSRASAGFMGQQWDTGETAFAVEFWAEVFRVLKPGGHVIAFSGTRTYHRLAVAIEDAGFEIRDQLGWLYGTGFPKSHSPGKQFDKALGWFDETEIERGEMSITGAILEDRGTALKPAWEPIVLARKPLIGTVVENVLAHGTGAINVGRYRIEGEKPATTRGASGKASSMSGTLGAQGRVEDDGLGRFPANILHDGSAEVAAALGLYSPDAIRFFYCAKAGKRDRAGSKHPTVKPVDLMRWLVRLVTPPGGLVLEPFAGSGTTLQAAVEEGVRVIGIEREAAFFADCCARLDGLDGAGKPPRKLREPVPVAAPEPPEPIIVTEVRLVAPAKPRRSRGARPDLQPSFLDVA